MVSLNLSCIFVTLDDLLNAANGFCWFWGVRFGCGAWDKLNWCTWKSDRLGWFDCMREGLGWMTRAGFGWFLCWKSFYMHGVIRIKILSILRMTTSHCFRRSTKKKVQTFKGLKTPHGQTQLVVGRGSNFVEMISLYIFFDRWQLQILWG